MRSVLALILFGLPSAAVAAEAFDGWHIGVAAGAVQTHFVVEDVASGDRISEPVAWGVGYGAFAGRDWAIGRRVLLGVGGEINLGGRTARAELPQSGGFASLSPRWGYSVSARAGVTPTDNTLLYLRGGYHAHRYRLDSAGAVDFEFGEWSRSFTLGIGGEARIAPNAAVRLEFHHLDGTRNQVLIGVPIRF
jgi:outer membrane immunogenic protein